MFIDEIEYFQMLEKGGIRSPQIVKIQNVVDYVESQPEKFYSFEDCYCWLPPFPSTWMEWSLHGCKVGVLISCNVNNSRPELGKYAVQISCYMKKKEWSKSASFGDVTIFVDEMGQYKRTDKSSIYHLSDYGQANAVACGLCDPSTGKLEHQAVTAGLDCYFIAALNFLHCKNVNLVEQPLEQKLMKARNKKNRLFFEKTYTLAIEPMKKVLNSEGNAQTVGIKQAFHICRGHFRTYDETSKGLFGRYHGTFWVPAHTRGDDEIGKIKKDYEIKLPSGKQ